MIEAIRSKDRYHAETDWLSTKWHFSFDHYHDPNNMSFGVGSPGTELEFAL